MIARIIMTAVSLGGCGIAATPAPAPAPAPARAVCTSYDGVVWFNHGDPITCDVAPPQTLTIVWNDTSEGEGWGGDASLAAADTECADMGGTAEWTNGDLYCHNVDY